MKNFLTLGAMVFLALAGLTGCPSRGVDPSDDGGNIINPPDDTETGEAGGSGSGVCPNGGNDADADTGNGGNVGAGPGAGHGGNIDPEPIAGSGGKPGGDTGGDTGGVGGNTGGDTGGDTGGNAGGGADPDADAGTGCNDSQTVICHIPPGYPEGAMTLCVGLEAASVHLEHGDYLGECNSTGPDPVVDGGAGNGGDADPMPDSGNNDPAPGDISCSVEQVMVCHSGHSGIPENDHTICVGPKAAEVHVAHGDYYGPCY